MTRWAFRFRSTLFRRLILVAVLSGCCCFVGKGGATEPLKINLFEGDAWLIVNGPSAEKISLPKEIVTPADQLIQTTSGGKIELRYPDACVLRIGPSSILRVLPVGMEIPRALVLSGEAWISAAAVNRGTPIRLATETCLITTDGIFRVSVHPDRAVEVKAYRGTTTVRGPYTADKGPPVDTPTPAETQPALDPPKNALEKWEYEVSPFTKLIVWPAGNATKPFRFAAKADRTAWVLWNEARDISQGR